MPKTGNSKSITQWQPSWVRYSFVWPVFLLVRLTT
jgi:hypothetical protein